MNEARYIRLYGVLMITGAIGCQRDDRPDQSGDFSGGSPTATSAGGIASAESGGPKLDVGGGTGNGSDGGDPNPRSGEGCQYVDMVLAVDNSGSMSEEHEALRGPVFQSFPDLLLTKVNNGITDFRLAVIDACPKPAYFHNHGAGGPCDFDSGGNYMESPSAKLADEYACVTDFTDYGFNGESDECLDAGDYDDDDEQVALTVARAVAADNPENHGFVRDDAVLFVVAITDEDEALIDAEAPQELYDKIVAAKDGDVTKVVFLGVGGGSDCDGPYGGAKDSVRLREVAKLFEDQGQGLFWDICDGSLEQAFEQTITTVVNDACEDFVPVG